jgi:hypothetical protein
MTLFDYYYYFKKDRKHHRFFGIEENLFLSPHTPAFFLQAVAARALRQVWSPTNPTEPHLFQKTVAMGPCFVFNPHLLIFCLDLLITEFLTLSGFVKQYVQKKNPTQHAETTGAAEHLGMF